MRWSLLSKLAIQGMTKHRTVYLPYLLAMIAIMSLEYIMVSLVGNNYVQTRHSILPTIIAIAIFFTSLLAVVFILYANNFIQRQRRKEFALYTVLGLENKHIIMIIFIEQLITWVFGSLLALGIGYLVGILMFMGLNRLMQDTGASLMDYPFSGMAALAVPLILAIVLGLITVINSFRLIRLSPSELLSQTQAGEAEPKSRWFLLLMGCVTLAIGYAIANRVTNPLESLTVIFVAILLVIVASYALFTSLSIIWLKRLKANKRYYYQSSHFLSVSGLLYRMKANAVSLASIAILCTGIILTMGTTVTLYLGMEEQANKMSLREFTLEAVRQSDEASNEALESQLDAAIDQITEAYPVERVAKSSTTMLNAAAKYKDGVFEPIEGGNLPSDFAFIMIQSVDDFNALYETDYQLNADEVLMASKVDKFIQPTLSFYGVQYHVKALDETYIPANYVGNIVVLVTSSDETRDQLLSTYQQVTGQGTYSDYEVSFDIADDQIQSDLEARLPADEVISVSESTLIRLTSAKQTRAGLYELNGGFLFLGAVVSLVLLIGTILMLYFKQISEGYQDQHKFTIMRKVGLPDKLIQQTISNQLVWIFALPIIVAVVHGLSASKIMYSLLGLLAADKLSNFLWGYGTVLVIFVLVYLVFYLITSRVYYRIVERE